MGDEPLIRSIGLEGAQPVHVADRFVLWQARDASGPLALVAPHEPSDGPRLEEEDALLRALGHLPGIPRIFTYRGPQGEPLRAFTGHVRPAWQGEWKHRLGVVAALAQVMSALHGHGLVHGALEPDRLVISDGMLLLLDLGRVWPARASCDDGSAVAALLAEVAAGLGDAGLATLAAGTPDIPTLARALAPYLPAEISIETGTSAAAPGALSPLEVTAERAAAWIGPTWTPAALALAAGLNEADAWEATLRLRARGRWQTDDGWSHTWVHAPPIESPPDPIALANALEALEGDDRLPAATLARLQRAAGDPRRARAALLRGARQATNADTALALAADALEGEPEAPDWQQAGEVAVRWPGRPEALVLAQRCFAAAPSARTAWMLGEVLREQHQPQRAIEVLTPFADRVTPRGRLVEALRIAALMDLRRAREARMALEALGPEPEPTGGFAVTPPAGWTWQLYRQVTHAKALVWLTRFDEALAVLSEARREPAAPIGTALAHQIRGQALLRAGRRAEAKGECIQGLKHISSVHDAHSARGQLLLLRATIAIEEEAWEVALDDLERAESALGQVGAPRALALCGMNRGCALMGLGRFEEALEHLDEALHTFELLGDLNNRATALYNIADTELQLGHLDEAHDAVDRVIPLLVELGIPWCVPQACLVRAQVHRALGRVDAARADGQAALEVARTHQLARDVLEAATFLYCLDGGAEAELDALQTRQSEVDWRRLAAAFDERFQRLSERPQNQAG